MKHKVLVDGREDYFEIKKEGYEPGETVEFPVVLMTDVSTNVTSKQVSLKAKDKADGGRRVYYFEMPDCDVEIEISISGGMVNPAVTSSTFMGGPVLGMPVGSGLLNLNASQPQEKPAEPDPYPWEGKPRFCPECGAPTKGAKNFCTECGSPLKKD